MNHSSIRKVAAVGLCGMAVSLGAPAAWGQQYTKEPVQVSGADLQAWLSKGFVFAGEDHTNNSVFMMMGDAAHRTMFYNNPASGAGTATGTARVDGNMLCTTWSFSGAERCREWYQVGENKYEQREKGSRTRLVTGYIISSRTPYIGR